MISGGQLKILQRMKDGAQLIMFPKGVELRTTDGLLTLLRVNMLTFRSLREKGLIARKKVYGKGESSTSYKLTPAGRKALKEQQ